MDSATGDRLPAVAVRTLGCKVNVFESAIISESLVARGMRAVSDVAAADIVVINTCTVTAEADRQARQEVRRAVRARPDAVVVVTGCYAQMSPEACADIPGVDLVVGNDRKLNIDKLLPMLDAGSRDRLQSTVKVERSTVKVGDVNEHVSLPEHLVSGIEGRSRAFLQVQQGCDQGCTFCIIHRARGPSRSIGLNQVVRQAERMVMNGYRELVICGVDLGDYGHDLDTSTSLTELLGAIAALPGDFRIRLSSLDPVHITDELIALFAENEKLCPHVHLSMQSGATLILKRMKRRYTREIMDERIARLRAAVPGLVMSADVMVGFPTESDDHFEQTLAAIEQYAIAYPHVFMYSSRDGTPAARIPRQVDPQTKKQRAAALRRAGAAIRRGVLASKVDTEVRVLTEDAVGNSGLRRARGGDYVPVYLDVGQGDPPVPGQWLRVNRIGVADDGLLGRIVP